MVACLFSLHMRVGLAFLISNIEKKWRKTGTLPHFSTRTANLHLYPLFFPPCFYRDGVSVSVTFSKSFLLQLYLPLLLSQPIIPSLLAHSRPHSNMLQDLLQGKKLMFFVSLQLLFSLLPSHKILSYLSTIPHPSSSLAFSSQLT